MQSLRPTLYEEFDGDEPKLSQYAKYDYGRVFESFKQLQKDAANQVSTAGSVDALGVEANTYLIERLAVTITKRRRQLRYWKRHAEKLAGVLYESSKNAKPLPTSPGDPLILRSPVPEIKATQLLEPGQATKASASELSQPSISSHTEVSQYNRKPEDDFDVQSQLSYASTALDTYGKAVNLPPAPPGALERAEFVCPYCGIACPANQAKDRSWRYFLRDD